jgi:hypothetical protein
MMPKKPGLGSVTVRRSVSKVKWGAAVFWFWYVLFGVPFPRLALKGSHVIIGKIIINKYLIIKIINHVDSDSDENYSQFPVALN